MNNEEMAERIVAVEQRSKSNTIRIDGLEKNTDALKDMVSVIKEMNVKQDYTIKKVDKIDERVDKIEQKPSKRWESVVEKVIFTIIGILIAYLFTKIGVK